MDIVETGTTLKENDLGVFAARGPKQRAAHCKQGELSVQRRRHRRHLREVEGKAMIRVFKSGEVARADILYRGESGSTQAVEDAVADILADVKKNGDAAVLRYCEKFDGVKLAGLRVAQADIDAAYEAADPEFIRTLTMAAGNIEAFHKRQIRRNFVINDTPGVVLGQKVTPIERVGLYVPGGTASYPSSVLMNAIPAASGGRFGDHNGNASRKGRQCGAGPFLRPQGWRA